MIVSNAAVNPSVDPILETKESVLDKLWDINVKAAILVLQVKYHEFRHISKLISLGEVCEVSLLIRSNESFNYLNRRLLLT